MKSKSFLFAIILLAAIGTIITFAQKMPDCKREGNQFQMFQKLNLSETQQSEIKNLKLQHQMVMVDLKANLQKQKLQLAELKNSGNYTRDQFIEQSESISNARNEIALSKANFQMDVYQLLDDNQKKEWNKHSKFCCEGNDKRMMRKNKNLKYD